MSLSLLTQSCLKHALFYPEVKNEHEAVSSIYDQWRKYIIK